MAVMNKRLLISESCDDSNRCTPYKGKHDQHDTYASHASPRTLPTNGPHTWQPFVSRQQRWMDTTAPKKKCSRLHLSTRLSGLWDPPQFLSQPSQ
jgi:hypothetical protein